MADTPSMEESTPDKASRPARRKRKAPSDVVRRRRPGYILVNGGWRRDPKSKG